jgi:hypothetical protein
MSSDPSQIITPMASIGGRSWTTRRGFAGWSTEMAWLTAYFLLDRAPRTPTSW